MKEYSIPIPKEKFESLKNDQKFLKILILARFVNALRFCQMLSLLPPISNSEGTYARTRHTINVPLFTISVLYEGFHFAEKSLETDKGFKEMDVYKNGIGAIISDEKNKKIINHSLSIMRNSFVFHFDHKNITKIGQTLSNYKPASCVFASAHGEAGGNMYYGFADEFFINYLLDHKGAKSDDELKEKYKGLLRDTLNLMQSFSDATEILIAEVLLQLGLRANESAVQPY